MGFSDEGFVGFIYGFLIMGSNVLVMEKKKQNVLGYLVGALELGGWMA